MTKLCSSVRYSTTPKPFALDLKQLNFIAVLGLCEDNIEVVNPMFRKLNTNQSNEVCVKIALRLVTQCLGN
jgi:hypothetical protein